MLNFKSPSNQILCLSVFLSVCLVCVLLQKTAPQNITLITLYNLIYIHLFRYSIP